MAGCLVRLANMWWIFEYSKRLYVKIYSFWSKSISVLMPVMDVINGQALSCLSRCGQFIFYLILFTSEASLLPFACKAYICSQPPVHILMSEMFSFINILANACAFPNKNKSLVLQWQNGRLFFPFYWQIDCTGIYLLHTPVIIKTRSPIGGSSYSLNFALRETEHID